MWAGAESMIKLLSVLLVPLAFLATLSPLVAADTGIAGKWHFVLETEGGTRTIDPVFEVSGNQVSGKWENDNVHGTYKDGKLALDFPVNSSEGGQGRLTITGTLTNGVLSGDWMFESHGGTFK